MEVRSKVFVVTGAGNGMGRSLALYLLQKGARVAAVDISVSGLAETTSLAGVNQDRLTTHVVNIADRAAVEALPQAVIAAHDTVDGLINCAGIIQRFIKFNELPYEDIERIMNVNFYGTVNMVKAFLPRLLERPEGYVGNYSSMGAFIPVPGQTIYGASKSAIKLLTEGLYAELLETNVHVSIIFPGAVATNIAANSGVVIRDTGSGKSMKTTSPEEAAEIVVRGIENNAYRILVGSDSKMMDLFSRISPKRATKFIASKMGVLLK